MTEPLTQLKQRLAEIYDLQRAFGVLQWDRQTMMPPQGWARTRRGRGDPPGDRPRALRRRRDRPTARAGRATRGQPRLRLRRREPDPRHPPRVGEGPPGPARDPRSLGARGRQGARRLARGSLGERLRRLPARVPARARRRAPLGGAHGAGRLAVRRLPRRVRAGDEDGRGEGGLRRAPARADRARAERRRAGRRLVPRGRLPGREAAGGLGRDPARLRLRGGHLPPRPDRAPVRDVLLRHGHPDDDALPARQPALALAVACTRRGTGSRSAASIRRCAARRSTGTRRWGSASRRAARGRTWSGGRSRSGAAASRRSSRRSRSSRGSISTPGTAASTASRRA